jgi:hypothetical protein
VSAPHLVKRETERWLRERGLGKTAAVAAVSRAWKRHAWAAVIPALFRRLAEREVGRG